MGYAAWLKADILSESVESGEIAAIFKTNAGRVLTFVAKASARLASVLTRIGRWMSVLSSSLGNMGREILDTCC